MLSGIFEVQEIYKIQGIFGTIRIHISLSLIIIHLYHLFISLGLLVIFLFDEIDYMLGHVIIQTHGQYMGMIVSWFSKARMARITHHL